MSCVGYDYSIVIILFDDAVQTHKKYILLEIIIPGCFLFYNYLYTYIIELIIRILGQYNFVVPEPFLRVWVRHTTNSIIP